MSTDPQTAAWEGWQKCLETLDMKPADAPRAAFDAWYAQAQARDPFAAWCACQEYLLKHHYGEDPK